MTAANQLSFEMVSQTGRSLDPPFVLLDSVQWSYYGETGEWLTTEANFKQTPFNLRLRDFSRCSGVIVANMFVPNDSCL
jgi:hypothetical protein